MEAEELKALLELRDTNLERGALVLHFTSMEVALKFILRNRFRCLFRFSKPSASNDLGDAEVFLGDLLVVGAEVVPDSDRDVRYETFLKATRQVVRNELHYACFCRVARRDPRAIDRPVLWSQYSDRDCGVAFVFDRNIVRQIVEEWLGVDQVRVGQVVYGQRTGVPRMIVDANGLEEPRAAFLAASSRYFEKHPDWSFEREWRVIAAIPHGADREVDLRPALQGVVLGARVPASFEAAFAHQVGLGAPILKLVWDDRRRVYGPLHEIDRAHYAKEDLEIARDIAED